MTNQINEDAYTTPITKDTAIKEVSTGFIAIWTNGRKNIFNGSCIVSRKTAVKRAKQQQADLDAGYLG